MSRPGRESGNWVSQVRTPGWHPNDRRSQFQDQFHVRGRYKGTYTVRPTPPRTTTHEAGRDGTPEQVQQRSAMSPELEKLMSIFEVQPLRRRAGLLRALAIWKRLTSISHHVRQRVRAQWHGDCRRAFTRWCRVAAARSKTHRLGRWRRAVIYTITKHT